MLMRGLHMAQDTGMPDIQLDSAGLYREDIFTDRKAGTIRRLIPVTLDGSTDASRAVVFSGQTQLLTPNGVLPLGFEIEAASLQDAIAKFPGAVKEALEQAIEEAREFRRESSSRIVVPDVAGGMGGAGPLPGGGKIKL
jgi:regulator of protease activity HflC (stomatin/prohibitin superfamily)